MKKRSLTICAALLAMAVGTQAITYTFTNSTDNQQGEVRTTTPLGGAYPATGSIMNFSNLRVGEYKNTINAWMARDVIKFGYSSADLGAEENVTNATLRLFVVARQLNVSGAGSSVLLSYSQADEVNTSNETNDFENAGFTLIGTMAGLDSSTASGAWYEFDVTAAVLDDLANDGTNDTAGSSFRMQLNDDLSLASSDALRYVTFTDYSDAAGANAPELILATSGSRTNVVPVVGLTADGDDAEVQLDWIADSSGLLNYYNIYRSSKTGTNYTEVATGITTNAYLDTTVINDLTYYYVVTTVGTDGWEAPMSSEVVAAPSAALTIVNLINNQQADARTYANTGDGSYMNNGTRVVLSALKAGEYGNPPQLSRAILKFPLQQSDLGMKTTNDIEKIYLRIYLDQNQLGEDRTEHQIDVYSAETEAANTAVAITDFENAAYTQVRTWTEMTTNSPLGWQEFEVTEQVLADLNNDVQDDTAGSCFRIQLVDDLLMSPTDELITFRFNDNSAANPPQLRIEFESTLPKYDQWVISYGGGLAPEADSDDDGLNNLYEYGLNGNPTNGTTDPAVFPAIVNTGSSLEYIHVVRNDDSNLVYTVLTTDNLTRPSWTNIGYTVGSPAAGTGALDTVTNTIDTASSDQLFIKLLIEN